MEINMFLTKYLEIEPYIIDFLDNIDN